MDIGSLPEELCTGILKYVNFSTITAIRRLNSRINQIIVKRGLHRVRNESLSFTVESDTLIASIPGGSKEISITNGNQDTAIGECLTQFTDIYSLSFQHVQVTEKLCQQLCKNKKNNRGLGRLSLTDCVFDVSEEPFSQVISGLTLALIVKNCRFEQSPFGNKIFEGVRLIELEISSHDTEDMELLDMRKKLTDTALCNILKQLPVRINLEKCSTGFTWEIIEETIKKYYKPENIVEWDFGIITRNEVTNQQIKSALSTLGIVVNFTVSGITRFLMRGKYNSENTISFAIQ